MFIRNRNNNKLSKKQLNLILTNQLGIKVGNLMISIFSHVYFILIYSLFIKSYISIKKIKSEIISFHYAIYTMNCVAEMRWTWIDSKQFLFRAVICASFYSLLTLTAVL